MPLYGLPLSDPVLTLVVQAKNARESNRAFNIGRPERPSRRAGQATRHDGRCDAPTSAISAWLRVYARGECTKTAVPPSPTEDSTGEREALQEWRQA